MRVAFYAPMKPPTDPNPSGDRLMARLLMRAWEHSGSQVELASRFRSYDKGHAIRQKRIKAIGKKLADRLINRYRLRPPHQRPDIWFTYHLYHKAPDWLGATVSTALKIPYVVAEASYAPKQRGGAWDLGHRETAESLAKANLVIGFNPIDGECIAPLLERPDRQVIVPPFIDTAPFFQAIGERQKHRDELSKRYGLNTSEPWLLTVAMMRPDQKLQSYQLLGEALEKIKDHPWQLLVVGSGPASDDVKAALGPLEGRVKWLGNQQGADLHAIYASSDVFVWPAIKEAYGMVFLEALSSGLPVIAGRSAGVEAIVTDGKYGFLVPLANAEAFANAVVRLLQNPTLRATMSQTARHEMSSRHDLRQMSATLTDLGNETIAGRYQ